MTLRPREHGTDQAWWRKLLETKKSLKILSFKKIFRCYFKDVMVPFKNLLWKSSMRIVKCSYSGPIATIVSCVPSCVGKSNICEPIKVYPSSLETPCLQGATTVRSFLVVNHQATMGMSYVPGSVTLGGFLLTLMGPTPWHNRIIGPRLFVYEFYFFCLYD
jgi:hypothetical protein